ncbi:MAG: hypothetical protein R3E12_16300 [Candidatus Eisenbacteria bacterium]
MLSTKRGRARAAHDPGTNFFAFYVLPTPGRPIVLVQERGHGTFAFPTDGPIWTIEAPTEVPLYFQWRGDASGYGGRPGSSNYALDIPDVEDDTLRDPRGIGGWIGWGPWQETIEPIVFPASEAGTTHHLWIKMRDLDDLADSERLCHVVIDLVGFRFDRHALIIDDSRIPGIPDPEHDAFLHTTVLRRLFDLGDVDFYATEDRPVLDLATLGRYRQVVWQTSDGVPRGLTGPIADLRRDLATYSAAGGRLFLLGDRLSCALDPPEIGSCTFPRIAPVSSNGSPDFQREGFLWQFMKYRGDLVTSLSGTTPDAEASGMVGARSLDPAYPDLSIDRAKWDPWVTIDADRRFRGGVKHWEGVLGRGAIERMAGLDSLYEVSTFDTTLCCGRVEHGLAHAIVAQRYRSTPADSSAGATQGRIAMFDFQPWWLEPTTLGQAGDAVIDWLVTGSDR